MPITAFLIILLIIFIAVAALLTGWRTEERSIADEFEIIEDDS